MSTDVLILAQVVAEKRESFQEFKRITNATLDGLDREQSETNKRLDAIELRSTKNRLKL